MSPRWPLAAALILTACGGSTPGPLPVAADAATPDSSTLPPVDSATVPQELEADSTIDAAGSRDSIDAGLGTCDVRDFGATGDGVTNDAVAIQKAIDHCSKVVVPAG